MTTLIRRSKSARKASPASEAALGRYLAAGLGAAGLASVDCEAGVVTINITNVGSNNQNISGANAGIPLTGWTFGNNATKTIQNFPIAGPGFKLRNYTENGYTEIGIYGAVGSTFQIATGAPSEASPFRFTATSSVGPSLPGGISWDADKAPGLFAFQDAYTSSKASNWGAGSYLGFRARPTTASNNWTYGYFEVTWNNTSNTFQILSGAYESTANTAITIAAVPEPSTVALCGIGALALGAGAIRRSRKARKAAAEGSLAEAV